LKTTYLNPAYATRTSGQLQHQPRFSKEETPILPEFHELTSTHFTIRPRFTVFVSSLPPFLEKIIGFDFWASSSGICNMSIIGANVISLHRMGMRCSAVLIVHQILLPDSSAKLLHDADALSNCVKNGGGSSICQPSCSRQRLHDTSTTDKIENKAIKNATTWMTLKRKLNNTQRTKKQLPLAVDFIACGARLKSVNKTRSRDYIKSFLETTIVTTHKSHVVLKVRVVEVTLVRGIFEMGTEIPNDRRDLSAVSDFISIFWTHKLNVTKLVLKLLQNRRFKFFFIGSSAKLYHGNISVLRS